MVKRHTKRIVRKLQRRLPVILIILGLVGVVTIGNIHVAQRVDEQIAASTAAHTQEMAALDTFISEATQKRIEAEKARKAADAKKLATEILSTPSEKAATIDASRCNVTNSHSDPTSLQVLVNKKHCLQPLNYAPNGLVTVYDATMRAEAANAFKQMIDGASAAGVAIRVTSSYRSYQNQIETYAYWVRQSGAAGADTYSARPGYSEHQTGLAVDVATGECALSCFGSTSAYTWLQANAATYGFIQRYYAGQEAVTGYQAEEWHYRYIGQPIAQDMKAKGIKTLEAYWNVPGGTY